jgi:hypothetical protein
LGPIRQYSGHSKWTFGLGVHFEWDPELEDFLELLKKAHILRIRNKSGVSGALALDFYKRRAVDDPGKLVNSTIGRLVRVAKGYEDGNREQSRRTLSGYLRDVAAKHMWIRRASRVLPVPGHLGPSDADLSHHIAVRLSEDLGLDIVKVDLRDGPRPPAKNMSAAQRTALRHGFRVRENLQGDTVLVVDDIYHTGQTMAGVANAAWSAGAGTVLGLVAVRNFSI